MGDRIIHDRQVTERVVYRDRPTGGYSGGGSSGGGGGGGDSPVIGCLLWILVAIVGGLGYYAFKM